MSKAFVESDREADLPYEPPAIPAGIKNYLTPQGHRNMQPKAVPKASARSSAIVKGFRMPASHCARGCTEAGVGKASKEETAGGVCAGGSVGLWGFKVRFCATWPLSDGTAGLNG